MAQFLVERACPAHGEVAQRALFEVPSIVWVFIERSRTIDDCGHFGYCVDIGQPATVTSTGRTFPVCAVDKAAWPYVCEHMGRLLEL